MILNNINSPKDVKKLNKSEKEELAGEIRNEIIDVVSKNGGHLASSLGVVELTIALHSCFDMPNDKIVWDVGHQTYAHKLLTGRRKKFKTLRKMNGISGFPKGSESKYDSFDTGHSSTSVSVALGMARARDILGKSNKVIAVIGDGALTGGMALEALNDAGISKTDLIVILNDNEMSISKNNGGMAKILSRLRTKNIYEKSNVVGKKVLEKIPFIGNKIIDLTINIKKGIKQIILPNMYFENIGFKYLGPVDGHNIEDLEKIFNDIKDVKGPILIHVVTKKGKGYKFAEENPDMYHSTSSFDIETGQKKGAGKKDYSKVFGDKLVELAKKDKKIVAVTAAMEDGTGLNEFAKKYPERFFNVEIAEQHAIALCAGMAKEGLKPVIPIYSSFLQRGYDQVIHDVCMQKLPVVICADRAGIVGNDGTTHQGLYDLAFLNTIPNLTIVAPKDFKELEDLLEFSINYKNPIAIRYPRGSENKNYTFTTHEKIKKGKAEIIKKGTDISIFAIGKMVSYASSVAEKVYEELGISCEVVNIRFLKPIDKETIIESAKKTKNVITIEDGTLNGGLGSTVNTILKDLDENILIRNMGYNDKFVKHGKVEEIEKVFGMDEEAIKENIIFMTNKK